MKEKKEHNFKPKYTTNSRRPLHLKTIQTKILTMVNFKIKKTRKNSSIQKYAYRDEKLKDLVPERIFICYLGNYYLLQLRVISSIN